MYLVMTNIGLKPSLTYELALDLALMKQITPVLPPGWMGAKWYIRRIA